MGDRIRGAKLMVNLHIAIYIVIEWTSKGPSMLGGVQFCTGRCKHKMWIGGGSVYFLVLAGASHFVVAEVGN